MRPGHHVPLEETQGVSCHNLRPMVVRVQWMVWKHSGTSPIGVDSPLLQGQMVHLHCSAKD